MQLLTVLVKVFFIIPSSALHVILGGDEVNLVLEAGIRELGAVFEVGMPGGNNATAGGALEVGVFAVVMSMLRTEAPPTGLPQQALFTTVVGLLLVALEAVGEGWQALSSFAQHSAAHDHGIGVRHIVRRFLGGMDGRDRHGGRSGRSLLVEVRDEAGADGCMCQATLDVKQLTLNATLVILYLCATPFEPFELVNIGAVPVDVSDYSRVAKGNNCIVDKLECSVGRVEDGVVHVLGTRASEIW